MSILLVGLLVMTIATSGCGQQEENTNQDFSNSTIGDIREETKSASVLPSFLDEKPEQMSVIYEAVVNHKEVVEQMPCYCGCGESVNHKSNYDCFVYDDTKTGSVVWDDHATKCGVCLETAVESINKYNEGKSIKEIRNMIDETYNNGDFAKPTPTPPVKS
ncbi:PCYCGC domain-containing protein [Pontibacillus sp. HMF3514]|uniref:PCYCGC domain-containing protein n=1 Tax=Pontibacillus sp. HMF3514 TaxID=2692425 RepID=UPI001F3A9671|nr:PCYCGC domain-containing protein [Pontibacillus sp. HMF3514]